MRIFSPAQAKQAAFQRSEADADRARIIAEATSQLLREKAEAEQSFEETLEKQRNEFADLHADFVAKKKFLEDEVRILEERRKQALMPPLIKEEDIHSIQERLHARKLELDLLESENEERTRLLMRKLDEVSSREQDSIEKEKRIKRLENSTETMRLQVAQDMKRLNLQLADFHRKSEEKEEEFAFKKSEQDARQNLLDDRERGFVEREREIQASMRLLRDQRILLEKGFEELRRLKQKHE